MEEQLSRDALEVQRAVRSLPTEQRLILVKCEAANLAYTVKKAAAAATPARREKAQSLIALKVAENIIIKAGGIFVGEKKLRESGQIGSDATVPLPPVAFSNEFLTVEFLNSRHLLSGGQMAAQIIVGFDPDTKEWYCREKSLPPNPPLNADSAFNEKIAEVGLQISALQERLSKWLEQQSRPRPSVCMVGTRLDELAQAQGLTRKQLAQMSGISSVALNNICAGRSKDPHVKTVLNIATALNVDFKELALLIEEGRSSSR